MLVTPSFDEVQDQVTAGTYKVIVKKGTVDYWDKDEKTKPYINWELETVGEPETKNNGRRIYHKTSLTGKGVFTLQQLYMAAMGAPLAGNFDTEEIVGKQVAVEVIDGIHRVTGEATGYTEVKRVKRINM